MAATRGTPAPTTHRSVRLSWAAALTVVGTLVGLVLAQRVFVAAHRPLSWAAAAVVAAVLLDPLVDRLAVRIRRVPAVVLVFLLAGGAVVGTTYLVFGDIQDAIDRLQVAAPDAATEVVDRDDRLGELARDLHLEERVGSFVEALEERVTRGDEVLRSTAGTAPTYFVSAILTAFLMTYGHQIGQALIARYPDRGRRALVADLSGHAIDRARLAIVLTVGLGLAFGLVTAGVASLLGLPAPAAVGFAAGLLALLPHVGLLVGSLPLLLLAVAFEAGTTALLLAGVVVAMQVLDSFVVRPWIGSRSVPIGLLAPWVVAMLGYSVYGIGGAAYSLAVVTYVLAVLDRLQELRAAPPAGSAAAPAGTPG